MTHPYHIPALLKETLEQLQLQPDGVFVDATYGGGGHSRAILERLGSDGRLYAFDRDADAIARAEEDPRLTLIHGNFRYLANFLRFYGAGEVDGILADLGVSFHHFDDAERGFSFRADGPLDMRMNRSASLTAAQILNTYSEEQLRDIFKVYGEFADAGKLTRQITKTRETKPYAKVSDLLDTVSPMLNPRREKKDLACVFQALRIEVNDEMGALRDFLEASIKVLRPGGRLCVITYHSLEDRLVKNFMRAGNFAGKVEQDFFGNINAPLKSLTNKPIVPDDDEVSANPRSRSAKLRVAELREQPSNTLSTNRKR
ncbi:MAG: 16S rRNA (cytosine(1402)-N(4))-methyltransferase RsmH [Muribaculaceae bacterium]|nr:16S rRNA (cytosine(1402)-N(4))-methyltransferase RsmH [Muribaculaceae bacterium]